ncbi:class I SAM-dependent methyltransferase [uncultured Rubinisphaera sp.]|uniref:class I SAM-dependent methyltransferase n=1 Tax=uncultured Rubinisphaera sp. TaxID=1678686 RepID=UPI0030D781C2|tara:strand:+ start:61 stop:756 length:696 start_codon:yes stop_codon:yes gene_type:complete
MLSRVKNSAENKLARMTKKLSRKGLYEFLSKEFAKISRDSSVLTIGSGGEVNELLNTFANKEGFTVLSFDIDRERSPDVVGDICTYDFSNKCFDVVIMSEVLEHVHSPYLAINNINSILNENGKLILTTPFMFPLHDRPYDYYRFTRFGLEFLLRDFKNVQVCERNSYFDAIDVLWVRLWQTQVKSARIASYFIIPFVFYLKRPFTYLLSMLIDTDAITTGYVVTAEKSSK